jgi:transposase
VTTTTECFVGIDASKDALDTHLLPAGTVRRFDNTPVGIAALAAWLQPLTPTLIVLEATGGYERPFLSKVFR